MTVVASVALLALLTLTVLMAQVGVAVVGKHRAQSAADLAALAAAAGLVDGTGAACARANKIGTRMGVRVIDCAVILWDVTVTVEGRMSLGPLGTRSVRAMARAGPMGDSD
ncbi:pilus assembly protein TadE [Nocardia sp. SYP-A9097]|uniref:Rv3654c family TadE-like protein n=1 Tax=Nocardia sp. SYP-A9097 TaxID=2663237 RepID=UPI0013234CAB|nr:Rv3654c family TadE-like protein [Nocardia sp. SYP-A9097]MRH90470.1 pilus assembly protein TadE [Nocardia sp. SYP-A9097]